MAEQVQVGWSSPEKVGPYVKDFFRLALILPDTPADDFWFDIAWKEAPPPVPGDADVVDGRFIEYDALYPEDLLHVVPAVDLIEVDDHGIYHDASLRTSSGGRESYEEPRLLKSNGKGGYEELTQTPREHVLIDNT